MRECLRDCLLLATHIAYRFDGELCCFCIRRRLDGTKFSTTRVFALSQISGLYISANRKQIISKASHQQFLNELYPITHSLNLLSRRDYESHVRYRPDMTEQLKWSPKGIEGTFSIEYDVDRDDMYGDFALHDG